MKYRIKFSKTGPVSYIGHLDTMRYFQKAVKRSGIDVKYSEGFSPHQLMSFASPLGTGVESTGDYVDITLNSVPGREALIDALEGAMAPGFHIVDIRLMEETGKGKSAMAALKAADYTVVLKCADPEATAAEIGERFSSGESLVMERATKKGSKLIDLKESIYSLSVDKDNVYLSLAAGSELNVKPEEALSFLSGKELDRLNTRIIRTEMYGEDENGLKPLIEFGTDF